MNLLLIGTVSDVFHEVIPCVTLQPCICDLLAAEASHCTQIVSGFLRLESWKSNLCKVDNKVILDDFIVLNILLCLGDVLQDILGLTSLRRARLKHALKSELTSIQLVNSVLVVLDLVDCFGLGVFNTFLPCDAF